MVQFCHVLKLSQSKACTAVDYSRKPFASWDGIIIIHRFIILASCLMFVTVIFVKVTKV